VARWERFRVNSPGILEFDPPARVLKRAQYKAFAFELLDGDVRVRNESYADPAAHEDRVRIQDGVPDSCAADLHTVQYDSKTVVDFLDERDCTSIL